jgi:hypothetical protein
MVKTLKMKKTVKRLKMVKMKKMVKRMKNLKKKAVMLKAIWKARMARRTKARMMKISMLVVLKPKKLTAIPGQKMSKQRTILVQKMT